MLETVALLVVSNVFMTYAWYGHLRNLHTPLLHVIVLSWLVAFFEYCFQVPANRHGFLAGLSAAQLKTIQEVITLVVFVIFAAVFLKEPVRVRTVAGFGLIAAGAALIFHSYQTLG